MDLKGAVLMSGQPGLMDNYMLVILGVMIAMGILGGIANYYMSERQAFGTRNDVLKYVVLGVVAALSVPLFLNMISSNLLDAARAKPADLFVFAGFCLIFSSSFAIITNNPSIAFPVTYSVRLGFCFFTRGILLYAVIRSPQYFVAFTLSSDAFILGWNATLRSGDVVL